MPGPIVALPQFPQEHGRCWLSPQDSLCPLLRRRGASTQRAASDFGTKASPGRRLRPKDVEAYRQADRRLTGGSGRERSGKLRGACGWGGGAADPSPLVRLIIPRALCNSVIRPGFPRIRLDLIARPADIPGEMVAQELHGGYLCPQFATNSAFQWQKVSRTSRIVPRDII